MSKELILIVAYCPNKERKEILFDFLKQLQMFRCSYDILVASHTPLDTIFFEYFDYFYYDKNNVILNDIEYRQNGWFSPFDNYVIWSSYLSSGNTIKAILDLLVPSISLAKNLKYKKIHYFEYDAKINDDKELIENSQLLNDYDYVIYNGKDTHIVAGGLISFKTDFVIDEWKVNSEEILIKSYHGVYPKAPEGILYNQIKKQRRFIEKNYHSLKSNGIEINTVHQNYSNWNVPFFDPNDLKLKFISYNETNEDYEIKVIVNEKLYNVGIMEPTSWKIIDLLDNFYDVEHIIVLKNNEKIFDLKFNDLEFKNKFIYYNSALDNSSLSLK
jgi:hypothetical protein